MLSNVDGVYYSISLLLVYQQCLRDLYLVIIIQNMPLTLESLLMFRLIGRNTFISMRLEELQQSSFDSGLALDLNEYIVRQSI